MRRDGTGAIAPFVMARPVAGCVRRHGTTRLRDGVSTKPATSDGQLWVVGVGEDGVMAFTGDGIENLKELASMHKKDPSIIEERRQILAETTKPKAEKPDGF